MRLDTSSRGETLGMAYEALGDLCCARAEEEGEEGEQQQQQQ